MNDKPLRTIVDVNKSLKVFAGSLRKIHISILESFSYDKMSKKNSRFWTTMSPRLCLQYY
jgi:hypothetical protein